MFGNKKLGPFVSFGQPRESVVAKMDCQESTSNGQPCQNDGSGDSDNIDKTKLIVNYIPQYTTEEDLALIFSQIGPIESIRIMKNLRTGYSYGYGFVKYLKAEDAAKAIEALSGLNYRNKRLKVSYSRPPGQTMKESNLYISNLPKDITEKDLDRMFGIYGEIIQRNVLKDKITGLPRGVAFVRFSKREEAQAAIASLDGKQLDKSMFPLSVRVADDHSKQKAQFLEHQSYFLSRGNTVTIAALIRCPKLRIHATTYFVLSLSISDLLFCSINLPLMADRYVHEEWRLGEALCKVFPVILYGNVALSLLNMVAITINRYVIISYYEYYAKFYSKLSIWIQLILIWCVAFLIMLPPLLGVWGQLGLHHATFSCTILKKNEKSPKQFIFLVGFVLPCLVIITSYTCIYLKVRGSKKNLKSYQSNTRDRNIRRERDDRRLTKLMLLIFSCFLFCFLPLMCVNVFDDDVTIPSLHVCASILAWASSVVNPIIYVASNKQYRTAYAKLFHIVKSTVTVSDSRQLSNSAPKMRNTENRNLNEGSLLLQRQLFKRFHFVIREIILKSYCTSSL